MKYISLLWMLVFAGKVSAQHLVYLADGSRMPGKIIEITAHKIKFKNLEDVSGPTYSRALDEIAFAFNASGSYLVFAEGGTLAKKEKEDFINPPLRSIPADILVDINGGIVPATIASESETEVVCTAAKGKKNKVLKATLCFVIRRNGTHQVFVDSKRALPILISNKNSINEMLSGATTAVAVEPKSDKNNSPKDISSSTVKSADNSNNYPDKELFKKKSLEKTLEFTTYVKSIIAANADKDAVKKATNLACDLFADEYTARVEVSNINNPVNGKFLIRDYLNRFKWGTGRFDNVKVEYANVNYVSNFIKGDDGNFYGTVSFVQKFQGFIDNKMVYGDVTKRTVKIIIKPYQKAVNGESTVAWDVFLGDIGVVETSKAR